MTETTKKETWRCTIFVGKDDVSVIFCRSDILSVPKEVSIGKLVASYSHEVIPHKEWAQELERQGAPIFVIKRVRDFFKQYTPKEQ